MLRAVAHMKEVGWKGNVMDTVCRDGRMGASILGTGRMTKGMGRESRHTRVAQSTPDIGRTITDVATDKSPIPTEKSTWVIGKMIVVTAIPEQKSGLTDGDIPARGRKVNARDMGR